MTLTQVSTGGIKDGQVQTADLADGQVTVGKLHADALDHTYTLGADGSNHYTFTGEGLTGAVNDPTLYLTRGKTYRFVNGNSAGAHPFRIQTTVNGSAGTEYNTGVTNNGGAGGSTIVFEVPHDAPDVLYYQCTSHGSMGGILYVTGALADGTVTTAKLADQAVTLAKLPHGTSSNDGKFLRANNGADPTFETVSSVGGATGVDFNDSVKARFGTGNDLEIHHDGSNSIINDNGTGSLRIQTGGTNHWEFGDPFLKGNDGRKIILGSSSDLQIYHDGSHSFIKDAGTGTLRIESSEVGILSADGSETMAQFVQNGAASLRYDNSQKLSTTTTGIEVHGSTDSARIDFGDAYSNSRIGFFGLNRFGIDGHDGLEVRDPSDSYATRLKIDQNGKFEVFGNRASANAQLFQNISNTNPEGLYIQFTQAAPNTASRHFLHCSDNSTSRAVIDSNGNLRNYNASYGGFSDASLKENIVDAGSQWDDIKNVKVRVFNFKKDGPSEKRIGVVAQEIETVCPKLVGITYDKDESGNLLETGLKSVKYSVLYMKAIKALQEAIAKIETLETKVAALEAA